MNLSRFLVTFVLGLSALSFTTSDAHAVPITVPNFSFEDDAVADGSSSNNISSWTKNVGSGASAAFNPASSDFMGATGQGIPSGGDGAQIAYLISSTSIQSAASLGSVQAGSQYSLTVAIGDFIPYEGGTVRLGFKIDDAFVSGGDTSFNSATYSPEGTFTNFNFNYTATAADAGKTLKIFLGQTGTGSNIVGFDNVRLVATPEPSTYAMMALGLCTIGLIGWKRKKNESAA